MGLLTPLYIWNTDLSSPFAHSFIHFSKIQSTLDISKFMGLFFTRSNSPKCKFICTSGNLDKLKSPQCQSMGGESNQNAFLIQIDASSFQEFKISEFEIARVDCIAKN